MLKIRDISSVYSPYQQWYKLPASESQCYFFIHQSRYSWFSRYHQQTFEEVVLASSKYKLSCFGNNIITQPHGRFQMLWQRRSNQHNNIKFTRKKESTNSFPFLDILMSPWPNGRLGHCMYLNLMHLDKYLLPQHHHSCLKLYLVTSPDNKIGLSPPIF